MDPLENQGFLPEGWERSETTAGIPYYINHSDGTTNWEHPTITKAFAKLDGVYGIKYGAYRTAMKLRALQKLTHLNEVSLHIVRNSLREFGLGPGSHRNSEVLSVEELEVLLVSIFQLAGKDRENFIEQEKCVELTLSFLLKCLDSGRTGTIKVRSLKIILVTLSTASLEDKYTFMYEQVSTENSIGISQINVKVLLQDLLMLTDSLNESSTFEQVTIDSAVESSWNMSKNQPTDTLNVEELRNWMLREPICIVWLPTLHRLATAETVKHEAKCSKCKAFPIVGFRYRCLKCSNVDLCQNCFWTQQTLKNHKLNHPTREYCLATTTGDDVRDFAKQLKNKITRKYRNRQPKVDYLAYPIITRSPQNRIPDQSPVFDNVHTRVNLLAARLHELEDVDQVEADVTRPSTVHATPQVEPLPLVPAPPEVELHVSSVQPPPAVEMPSPIISASPAKPDMQELEAKLKLESRIIDLQGSNKTEVKARKKLEKHVTDMELSKVEDLETISELEQRVHDLQESNQLYKEKVSQLLATPPLTKTVRVLVPTPVQSPLPSMMEMRTQGVNTPYQFLTDGWSHSLSSQTSSLLGGEEEDMEAILKDLLAAFPKETTKSIASDMNSTLFKAVKDVRADLTSLVSHIKHT